MHNLLLRAPAPRPSSERVWTLLCMGVAKGPAAAVPLSRRSAPELRRGSRRAAKGACYSKSRTRDGAPTASVTPSWYL